jgi:hypothetical protein
MEFGKRKYRMVFDEKNRGFIIEKKVNLLFLKYWTRNYLRDGSNTCYHTDELALARKIVNILNGKDKVKIN